MVRQSAIDMERDERDEFLGSSGTAVVSLGTGEDAPPHSIPVSYGYDATEEVFYLRLAVGREHAKGDPTDSPVSLVVHGEVDGRWHSVVARGRLERTTDDDIAIETLEGLDRVDIPYVDIFERPLRQVDFEFFRLDPTDLTARTEADRPE